MNILRLFVVVAAVCFAGAAQAQIVWSMSAANCVAIDASIQADRYKTNGASVEHKGTKTGTITLNCPVTWFDDDGADDWQIGMNYRDSTGTATTAIVRARLYTMSPVAVPAAPTLLAQVNSNSAPNVKTDSQRASSEFTHTFSFSNSYWIRVDLDRDTAEQIVKINAVYIRFAPVVP